MFAFPSNPGRRIAWKRRGQRSCEQSVKKCRTMNAPATFSLAAAVIVLLRSRFRFFLSKKKENDKMMHKFESYEFNVGHKIYHSAECFFLAFSFFFKVFFSIVGSSLIFSPCAFWEEHTKKEKEKKKWKSDTRHIPPTFMMALLISATRKKLSIHNLQNGTFHHFFVGGLFVFLLQLL